jgi:hypothetical protein
MSDVANACEKSESLSRCGEKSGTDSECATPCGTFKIRYNQCRLFGLPPAYAVVDE